MKHVLILGGSGLVGKAIIREFLAKKEWELYCTVHQGKAELNDNQVFRFDVNVPDQIQSILEQTQPQIIISCLRGDFEKQLFAHTQAAEYLKKDGGKFLFFSTTNVFDNDMSKPHYEDDIPNSGTDYGRYKIACEQKLQEQLGEQACIIRIPQVWGKGSPRLNQLKNSSAQKQRIVVYPKLNINTITDTMIAKKLAYVLEHERKGIFHFCAKDSINYASFYRELADRLQISNTALEENQEESGEFVLLSKRDSEFPKELCFRNQDVINEIVNR